MERPVGAQRPLLALCSAVTADNAGSRMHMILGLNRVMQHVRQVPAHCSLILSPSLPLLVSISVFLSVFLSCGFSLDCWE